MYFSIDSYEKLKRSLSAKLLEYADNILRLTPNPNPNP